ncbi:MULTISPECIES: ABC transporter permease [unclassified Microbacterium]|uniref:ABC transporter permease n=1 Tax=unclassified Microbacterium TaxID=2609290 RepID=UPI000EAA87DC|nr:MULTISPECIES: ABC transporter permease [unclassified Microbacterium]MBT2484423.1 ABC transporter permease [Microbacterium sp. ISL-108]RKN67333.1 ABC transporter permease [Microbacterium sp. CGR2]
MKIPVRFIAGRTAFYLFTAWAAITINFFLPRMMKGDPVTAYMQKNAGQISPEAERALRILFGLDEDSSLWQQYVDYWQLLFSGDLGRSFSNGLAPVGEVIAGALPWTVGLVGIATILSFLIGTAAGAVIGWRRGSRADVIVPISTFFSTVPYFWLGLIAIAVLSSTLGWFPASHAYDKGSSPEFSADFVGQVIAHGALPVLTIVVASLGGWILGMRNMMLTVLDEDYITVAQAKGMPNQRVLWRYAARNAVLPQLSSFALSIGFIVGGTIVMEMVFSYPGVGKLLLDATNAKDYPLMQGLFLIITMAVLLANILADIAYAVLDPRTRQSEA